MKTKVPLTINLASDPFRRERADNAAFALLCGLLLCSLFVLSGLILHERSQAADLRRKIEAEQTQLSSLRRQQNLYSAVLAKPENAGTFAYSVFMNQIIARRAVSWTHAFSDLGKVMPENVRLLGIRLPQIDSEDPNTPNRVELDMVVATALPQSAISLLKNLEKSPLFGPALLVSSKPPSQGEPYYQYRVTVPYDQKL